MTQFCVRCDGEVEEELIVEPDELVDGCRPVCKQCLEHAVIETLEWLGNPMVLDEDTQDVYMPEGIQN